MGSSPFQSFSVRYGAGERIYSEGDLGTTMYIVQSGLVRLFRHQNGSRRQHSEMEKGDFFGEMSILEGLPRNLSAEAVEDTELIEINSMTFDKMIKGNIEIAIRMLRKLSLRLRESEQALESLESKKKTASPVLNKKTPKPGPKMTGIRLIGEEDDTVFLLEELSTMIGRFDPVTSMSPDIDLTPLDMKRSVSRRHAQIVLDGDTVSIIEEVGAINGTYVNGEKLETGRSHELNHGDTISLGMVKLRFHA
jgi:CRP-like cAMP-binding protein